MAMVRRLGRTGLEVSTIAMGTVALGMDYGLAGPMGAARPDVGEASNLLNEALDRGVTLFDTAPAYGCSEEVVGKAIGHREEAFIATKVSPPQWDGRSTSRADIAVQVQSSLRTSQQRLGRECLDLVQIHNATVAMIDDGPVPDILLRAKEDGVLRFIGASVYGEAAALRAVECGVFDVVQVAFNILDQRMSARVFPLAEELDVGLILRSAFLKGVLTPRGQWLTEGLHPLREAGQRVVEACAGSWEELPTTALRFCASAGTNASVLVGVRDVVELATALQSIARGPLTRSELSTLSGLALHDDSLLNPAKWPRESVVN